MKNQGRIWMTVARAKIEKGREKQTLLGPIRSDEVIRQVSQEIVNSSKVDHFIDLVGDSHPRPIPTLAHRVCRSEAPRIFDFRYRSEGEIPRSRTQFTNLTGRP